MSFDVKSRIICSKIVQNCLLNVHHMTRNRNFVSDLFEKIHCPCRHKRKQGLLLKEHFCFFWLYLLQNLIYLLYERKNDRPTALNVSLSVTVTALLFKFAVFYLVFSFYSLERTKANYLFDENKTKVSKKVINSDWQMSCHCSQWRQNSPLLLIWNSYF